MQRASEFRVQDGVTLRTCSAEDLVVFKAFPAGRKTGWTSKGSRCVSMVGSTYV